MRSKPNLPLVWRQNFGASSAMAAIRFSQAEAGGRWDDGSFDALYTSD